MVFAKEWRSGRKAIESAQRRVLVVFPRGGVQKNDGGLASSQVEVAGVNELPDLCLLMRFELTTQIKRLGDEKMGHS